MRRAAASVVFPATGAPGETVVATLTACFGSSSTKSSEFPTATSVAKLGATARDGADGVGSAAESAVNTTGESTEDEGEAASTFCGTGEDDDGEEEGAAECSAASDDDGGWRGAVVTGVPPPKRTRVGSVEFEEESLLRVKKGRRQFRGQQTRLEVP